jgi:hypothetical protein
MEKDFVPYEISLSLKELEFDEPCFGYYEPNGELNYVENHILKDLPYLAKNSEWQDLVAAPTFSQAFRFFREKYGLFAEIKPYLIVGTDWWYKISDRNNSSGLPYEVEFETYEEAELACLITLIEIVK